MQKYNYYQATLPDKLNNCTICVKSRPTIYFNIFHVFCSHYQLVIGYTVVSLRLINTGKCTSNNSSVSSVLVLPFGQKYEKIAAELDQNLNIISYCSCAAGHSLAILHCSTIRYQPVTFQYSPISSTKRK